MIVEISNKVRFLNPTEELKEWCENNLTIDNPEYSKKVRMGFWVGNTPKKLSLYEVVNGSYVLPYGVLTLMDKGWYTNNIIIDNFAEHDRVEFEHDIPLYPYQEKAVQKMYLEGMGILQSQAGSGKTQMGIALAALIGKPTLWLCHTLDLVKQSRKRAEQYIDKSLIGEISGGKVEIGKLFTFATVQTMSNLDLSQYKDMWEVIIVDECHRVSGSPTSLTMYSKVLNSLAAMHKYGLSATVHRSDGMILGTYALLGNVRYEVPDEEIADKVVSVAIQPVETEYRITSDALDTDGMIIHSKLLNSLCTNEIRTELIAEYICKNADKSCLVLSDRLNHLESLVNLLPKEMRDKAVLINGKSKKADREKAIEDMQSGEKRYLFATYSLAKEGLDIPRLERLFLATPQKDYAVITQSIGRVARSFEGKDDPIAYDFVDNDNYFTRMYKARCRIYHKNNCEILGGQ